MMACSGLPERVRSTAGLGVVDGAALVVWRGRDERMHAHTGRWVAGRQDGWTGEDLPAGWKEHGMNVLIGCWRCGGVIGNSGYATDGTGAFFHASCAYGGDPLSTSGANPSGFVEFPPTMNFTKCAGIETVMIPWTDP